MSGDGVSEAVAAAFGRSTGKHEGSSDAAAVAFGRPSVAQESLAADLVAAGYSERGARRVLSRLDDGLSAELALAPSPFCDGEAPVSGRVRESAMGVLRRHGRVVEEQETPPAGGMSPAVREAHDRLAAAYQTGSPQYGPEGGVRYADAAVKSWMDTGIRQGWSERQVVEALNGQRATVVARGQAARKVVQR